ncbi:MAG: sulfatase-like hydrolase/transferase [Planctomycetota bacterium]|nr:sulfatase-like hydrolase/transferase [Planctomycetota bacterium]
MVTPPSIRRLALLAVPILAAACAGGAADREAGSGVLVIVIDALRADHMGLHGYDRDTTPVLDGFAAGAVTFADTWSAAPRDLPAHLGLLTGTDPNLARRYYHTERGTPEGSRFAVPFAMPHMAVSFLGAGFETAAFLDSPSLQPVTGIGAGFQVFEPMGEVAAGPVGSLAGPDVGIEGVSRRFLAWVNGREGDSDWFAYLDVADLERTWGHRDPAWDGFFEARPGLDLVPPISNDPEAFFAQPRSRWLGGAVSLGDYEARYDGRLRRLDGRLGALFEELRRADLWEGTTICIVGSYGLQFGEAGLILDHGLFSSADLRVPWLLKPADADAFQAGLVTPALASTLDLAPTLLDLAGVERPAGMHGVSQVPNLFEREGEPLREFAFGSCGLLEGGVVVTSDHALELTFPGKSLGKYGQNLSRAWFGDELVHDDAEQRRFYDRRKHPLAGLELDPVVLAEEVPLAERNKLEAAAVRRFFYTHKARRALHGSSWRGDGLGVDEVKELIELGYLGSAP